MLPGKSQRFTSIAIGFGSPVVHGSSDGRAPDDWLTVKEAAAHLKVSTATLYKMCDRGYIRYSRAINSIRIATSELARYVADRNGIRTAFGTRKHIPGEE